MLDSFNSENQALTAKKLFFDLWFYQPDERVHLKSTFLKSADFLANVRVLLGMQHANNYRFDFEFVLKYYSNRSPRGENYTLLLLRPIKRPI